MEAVSGNGSASSTASRDCLEPYNTAPYVAVAAVRAAVGAFSAACCLAVLVAIAVQRRYRDFPQRLVLHLAITALFHSLSYTVARVNFYSELTLLDPYCYFAGFINQYSAWVEVLALMCIVYYLFVAGLLGRPAVPTRATETTFWVGTYALPLLWCWLPFIHQSYGTAGSWCGIRTLAVNCTGYRFGQILQFALWYIPLYLLLLITCCVAVSVAVKVQRDVHRWAGLYDEETRVKRERIRTEIRPLLWFPFIYLALNTFSLIDRIYNSAAHPEDPLVELTFLHACSSPLRGAFVALVFSLAAGSMQRQQWVASCLNCCRRDDRYTAQEYPALTGDYGDSLSHPYQKNEDWD